MVDGELMLNGVSDVLSDVTDLVAADFEYSSFIGVIKCLGGLPLGVRY